MSEGTAGSHADSEQGEAGGAGQLVETPAQVLERAGPPIEALASDPVKADDFVNVLARLFAKPVTPDTYGELIDRAARQLSWDGLGYVTFLAADSHPVPIEESGLSEKGQYFLRRILDLFGSDIELAYDTWRRSQRAHDWKRVLHRIYREVGDDGEYRVDLEVYKNNGEVFEFAGSPDSLARLIRALLNVLIAVDDPAAVSSAVRKSMLTSFGQFESSAPDGPTEDA